MPSALCHRYREYQVEHDIKPNNFDTAAIRVIEQIEAAGFEAFLVGGCLRDAIAGIKPKDFDIATNATPEQLVKAIPKSRLIGRRFKIVHVRRGREILEVTTFRGHSDSGEKESKTGRLLRDNNFGSMLEDAERRDFTINALYYHPSTNTLLDFVGGINDIKANKVVIIGKAEKRYQEDPVRMIRALRFSAKLGFHIDTPTAEAIKPCAHYLGDIPAARMFDEVLKLLMSGAGVETFTLLREYQLFRYLFPASDSLIETGNYNETFLIQALKNTDHRLRIGKYVTPAYLYACMMWPAKWAMQTQAIANGTPVHDAQRFTTSTAIEQQVRHTAIPKRFSVPMREIWDLQHKLERRAPKQIGSVLQHPRFRAAYDFLLLRDSAGEELSEQCEWWTAIQEMSELEQQEAINTLPSVRKSRSRRPRQHG